MGLIECISKTLAREYSPLETMLLVLAAVPLTVLAIVGDENAVAASLFLLLILYIGYYGLAAKPRMTNTMVLAFFFLIGQYGFLLHVGTSIKILPLVIVEETTVRSLNAVRGTMYPDIGQLLVLVEMTRLYLNTRSCGDEDINTPIQA